MTTKELFEQFDDEYLKFDRVKTKRSNRPDLHAFLLLDELSGKSSRDIICAADHDEIWLDVDKSVIEALTKDQVLELKRCGVRLDDDGLCMFA